MKDVTVTASSFSGIFSSASSSLLAKKNSVYTTLDDMHIFNAPFLMEKEAVEIFFAGGIICEKIAMKVISFEGVIAVDPERARRPPIYNRIITTNVDRNSLRGDAR